MTAMVEVQRDLGMETARQIAARAAHWLDTVRGKGQWEDKVDTDHIDMFDVEHCIAGYVFADDARDFHYASGYRYLRAEMHPPHEIVIGFAPRYRMERGEDGVPRQHDLMAPAWKELIEGRRAATHA